MDNNAVVKSLIGKPIMGIAVIKPGGIATRDFRTDNSCYFAEIKDGKVIGGHFG